MAATVPVEKEGQASPLVEQAQQIGMPAAAKTTQVRQEPQSSAAEPRVGSFEAFMSSFGSPRRWSR